MYAYCQILYTPYKSLHGVRKCKKRQAISQAIVMNVNECVFIYRTYHIMPHGGLQFS